MSRPRLDENISPAEFREYYWLKEELVAFCREVGIDCSGAKSDISDRIEAFLRTGVKPQKAVAKKLETLSSFDWNNEVLSPATVITDNYKNTQNVRKFFTQHIGTHFSFNVQFMNWTKANVGETLETAIAEWKRIHIQKKDKNIKTEIAPQFEYNRYIRDFLADNPDKTIAEAIHFWKLKKSRKGTNRYEKGDLETV